MADVTFPELLRYLEDLQIKVHYIKSNLEQLADEGCDVAQATDEKWEVVMNRLDIGLSNIQAATELLYKGVAPEINERYERFYYKIGACALTDCPIAVKIQKAMREIEEDTDD